MTIVTENKKYEKNSAFTLVEILIVVIIIGILAGLMALSAGSSTETAERTACRGDQRTVKSAYYVESAERSNSFKTSIENAMAQFSKAQEVSTGEGAAMYKGICPAGGEYIMVQDIVNANSTNGKLTIMCTVEGHNGDAQLSALERLQLWSNIINGMKYSGLNDADFVSSLNQIFGTHLDTGSYFGTNDQVRDLIAKKFDTMPALEKDSALYKELKNTIMKDQTPYVQPYFINEGKETIYWISPKEKSTDKYWYADAIYYNGNWYMKKDGDKYTTSMIAGFNNAKSVKDALQGIGMLDNNGSISSNWVPIG